MSEDRVLAIVNGREITDRTVATFLRDLGPQKAQQFNSPEGHKKVLDELICEELLYSDAIDNGYDEEDEFLDKLDQKEEELLKQYAMFKLVGSIEVTDEEVDNYYKENKPNFFRDLTLRASHILVDSEDKANKIIEELNNGLDFAEAATKYSSCPSNKQGGDLGYFEKGKMIKEFDDAAFNMEVGQVSNPVQTKFGYHIIKITDRIEAGIMPYDEVKDNLKVQLIRGKQTLLYNNKIQELRNKYRIEVKTGENN